MQEGVGFRTDAWPLLDLAFEVVVVGRRVRLERVKAVVVFAHHLSLEITLYFSVCPNVLSNEDFSLMLLIVMLNFLHQLVKNFEDLVLG